MEWTRINNDTNGNPRYVVHFLECCPKTYPSWQGILAMYKETCKLMNKIGGRKYTSRSYGGGIVFSSYNLQETEKRIIEILNDYNFKGVKDNDKDN